MNSPNIRELFDMFDHLQKEQPIGRLVAKNVDNAIKRHPIPTKEKSKKKREKKQKEKKQEKAAKD